MGWWTTNLVPLPNPPVPPDLLGVIVYIHIGFVNYGWDFAVADIDAFKVGGVCLHIPRVGVMWRVLYSSGLCRGHGETEVSFWSAEYACGSQT